MEVYIPPEAQVKSIPLHSLSRSLQRKMGLSAGLDHGLDTLPDAPFCIWICPALFQRKGPKEEPQAMAGARVGARQQVLNMLGSSRAVYPSLTKGYGQCRMTFVTAHSTAFRVLKETLPLGPNTQLCSSPKLPQGAPSQTEQDAVIIHRGRVYLSVKNPKQSTVQSVSAAAQSTVQSVSAAAQSTVQSVSAAAQSTVQSVSAAAQSTVQSVSAAAQLTVQSVSAAAQSTVQSVSAAAQSTVQSVSAAAQSTVQSVSAAAQSTVQPISAAAQSTVQPISAAAQSTVQPISAAAPDTGDVGPVKRKRGPLDEALNQSKHRTSCEPRGASQSKGASVGAGPGPSRDQEPPEESCEPDPSLAPHIAQQSHSESWGPSELLARHSLGPLKPSIDFQELASRERIALMKAKLQQRAPTCSDL
ncbi:uncharacterized protein [Eucyclogobius newberryi]|uniref:uncharacterized protein n=1 Tax=Eucyclogobius newberryi TaxID=166745 RepID=UPI003B5B5CC2